MSLNGRRMGPVALGALGVVFGDIGTSPLYAFRSVLGATKSHDATTVLGLTSLVIWSLMTVVTVLYVSLLLRTDNDGEGGLLALLALLRRSRVRRPTLAVISVAGMAGAAMFLGDGVITPAISVLSAAEGGKVVDPALERFAVPLAVVVLIGIFVLQRVGSGTIGRLYGPVMAVWFLTLAVGGAASLAGNPTAARALSPISAIRFAAAEPLTAFVCLGSVILVVTGAEALYADLGHFGAPAIRQAWFLLVFPALILAYLGEAAQVLQHPAAAENPFYSVVPSWATIPMLVIATLATIIASEAVIAGAFTVVHQAAGLGFLPFLQTRHPSEEEGGQIYIPALNWALAAAVLAVVIGYGSSERLSSAYGVAVSVTILVTVILYLCLQWVRSGRLTVRLVVASALLAVIVAFVASSTLKVVTGGWLPLGIGAVVFVIMTAWRNGRGRLRDAARQDEEGDAADVLNELSSPAGDQAQHSVRRVPGCGVFLTEDTDVAPAALRTLAERMHTLPEQIVLLSWRVEDNPSSMAREASVSVTRFGPQESDRHDFGLVGVDVVLGYRERLDVNHVLQRAIEKEPDILAGIDPDEATYCVSEAIPRLSRHGAMPRWQQRLFLTLSRLTTDRIEQLQLPRARSIIIGRQVDL